MNNKNMSKAIAQLAPFLSPTPSYQDQKSVDYTKFKLVSSKLTISQFMEGTIMNEAISSFEMILLVVECIKKSDDSVKKQLFVLNEKTQSSPGKIIFVKWLSSAIKRIEERQKDGDIFVAGDSRVEEMIAVNIMELIGSFSVIKKIEQLELIKSKFGVDWVSIVLQVSSIHRLSAIGLCTSLDI